MEIQDFVKEQMAEFDRFQEEASKIWNANPNKKNKKKKKKRRK